MAKIEIIVQCPGCGAKYPFAYATNQVAAVSQDAIDSFVQTMKIPIVCTNADCQFQGKKEPMQAISGKAVRKR